MQARADMHRPIHHNLYATSRGRPLQTTIHNDVPLSNMYCRGGAKYPHLLQEALTDLSRHRDPESCMVYFIGGLPSVTQKDEDSDWAGMRYEEVVFVEQEDAAVSRVCNLLDKMDQDVRNKGATPCFSTIIPMSIRVWNETRLAQGRTSMLLHSNHYDDMQHFLINTIRRVNAHIVNINVRNQVATPHLYDTVVTFENSSPRIHYNRLTDGVHLKQEIANKCARKLKNAMAFNAYVLGRALGNNVKYGEIVY